ncbi:MAG: hypothetical protein K2Y22_07100 [Candidatus Obscuribacterales bacterium]|nr:hypothetical protein [Candidatus Obscuribacterales bacterium]
MIKPNTVRRSQSAQSLVEGAVGLAIVIAIAIGAVLLLTDSYLANSYKIKLGLITDLIADYLSDAKPGQDLNQLGQTKANQLIAALALPMSNAKTTVVVANNLLVVTVTGKCTVLQTGLPILPPTIELADTAAAPIALAPTWDGWLEGMRNIGQGPSVYMPVKSPAPGNVLGSLHCGP